MQISSIEEENPKFFTLVLPVTFLLANFLHFSQEISLKFCIFLIAIFKFYEEKMLGHISTFFKIQSPIRKKRLKILKKVFYKSFLELLFYTYIYTSEPLSLSKKTS